MPVAAGATALAPSGPAHGQSKHGEWTGDPALIARIEEIMGRPEFQGARWGMAYRDAGDRTEVCALRPTELFNAASSFKVFVSGTAFAALGSGHRARTRVYRTGPVSRGVLHGDLVLVAGGDLLIGGRLRPDGSLALTVPDHAYDDMARGSAAPGDPLAVLRGLARQIAARGVRRVTGRVLVDTSLFQDAREPIANGGHVITVSPMMVNDNIIDVTVYPGDVPTAPAVLRISPDVGYLHITNEVRTISDSDAATARPLAFEGGSRNPDGTRRATLTGDIPLSAPQLFRAYFVPEPAVFGARAFAAALNDAGVAATVDGAGSVPEPQLSTAHYTSGKRVAEHVSPPLSVQVQPMLRVSSNVHTVNWPYVVGAVAGHEPVDPVAAYVRFRHELYARAGVEPDPEGAAEGRYTADFFTGFLSHMTERSDYRSYRDALSTVGQGTPAEGHVFAKGGGGRQVASDGTSGVHKALAGFVELADGHRVVFAQFMELKTNDPDVDERSTRVMGELATTVYSYLSSK